MMTVDIKPKVTFDYRFAREVNLSPVISIITVFYNIEDNFKVLSLSISKQTFQQFEWIIIIDEATDLASFDILQKYINIKDIRLKIINNPTRISTANSKNIGVKVARSDYIVIINEGEFLDATTLEKWLWFLISYPEFSYISGYKTSHVGQTHEGNNMVESVGILDKLGCDFFAYMARKEAIESVNGFNKEMSLELEDLDLWLRFACKDFIGYIVNHNPEYKVEEKNDVSSFLHKIDKNNVLTTYFKNKYPSFYSKGFRIIGRTPNTRQKPVLVDYAINNKLVKTKRNLLVVLSCFKLEGADKRILNIIHNLVENDWSISMVNTSICHSELENEFNKLIVDIFNLSSFLHIVDFPRFIKYLIESRNFDAILVSNTEFGYDLLPFIRAGFPGIPIVDCCYMEEDGWKGKHYQVISVINQPFLEKRFIVSNYSKSCIEKQNLKTLNMEIVTADMLDMINASLTEIVINRDNLKSLKVSKKMAFVMASNAVEKYRLTILSDFLLEQNNKLQPNRITNNQQSIILFTDRLEPAKDEWVWSRGISGLLSSLIKKTYNFCLKKEWLWFPRLIKIIGVRIHKLGFDLANIDG